VSWQPRTTLKEIAKQTGLSVAAVSMALRDHVSLPAATVARVKRAAKALDYTPNAAATALAAHRQRVQVQRDYSVLALVSNWTHRDQWIRRESAQRLLAGATARAQTYGYEVQHLWAREDGMSPQRFSRVLLARGIRGIVLAPPEQPDSRFDLDWAEFAVVTIERLVHYEHFHHVVPNYAADLRLAWDALYVRGYRRVGLVIDSSLATRVAHQWEAAYAYAQLRSGLPAVPSLVVNPEDPQAQVKAWLGEHRPDAVISRCDHVLPAAAVLKLRIPRDLGYASLNVVDDAPHVSGIFQHRDAMGATAVDVMHSLLHRNHRGPNENCQGTHIDGSWRPGRTVRNPLLKAAR